MISINRLNRLNRKKSQNRLNRFIGQRINNRHTEDGRQMDSNRRPKKIQPNAGPPGETVFHVSVK